MMVRQALKYFSRTEKDALLGDLITAVLSNDGDAVISLVASFLHHAMHRGFSEEVALALHEEAGGDLADWRLPC